MFFAVYDSLIIFRTPFQSQYHYFDVFNVKTGEYIGPFCIKGRGPGETIDLAPVSKFFKRGDDIVSLMHAFNQKQLLFWNISQSVEKGKTIFDTIVSYENRITISDRILAYQRLYYFPGDTLFVKIEQLDFIIGADEALTPFYQKRTLSTDELLHEYPIYKKPVHSVNAALPPKEFFHSREAVKPNGSKIIEAMVFFPQINILDTHTGDVVGYRMKDGPDFSLLFETKLQVYSYFYTNIQADDYYVYASYCGQEVRDPRNLPPTRTIQVLDWSGNQLYELVSDRGIGIMRLDQVKNRLYMTDWETNEVFYLDLNDLDGHRFVRFYRCPHQIDRLV